MAETGWPGCASSLKGVILDLCGVLYDSGEGGGVAIPGSVEALKKLKASDLQLRFCTNESQQAREAFVAKLQRLGFDISVPEVFSPAPAAVAALKDRGLRPHLLVCDELLPEFDGVDKAEPNCVVIGDAAEKFSYQNLNEAFRVLIGLQKPALFSLGQGRYYKEMDGLKLDVGVYMKALEYACDVQAEVFGKPSPLFFQSALHDMGLQPHEPSKKPIAEIWCLCNDKCLVPREESREVFKIEIQEGKALMIGDDLVNDVGGAQRCGIKGVQVRTGKYRPSDEKHPMVTADGIVDNLAQAVDMILSQRH